jgi:hypothetical protein
MTYATSLEKMYSALTGVSYITTSAQGIASMGQSSRDTLVNQVGTRVTLVTHGLHWLHPGYNIGMVTVDPG